VKKQKPVIKIFCDFDGTIAKNDVCINSFDNFIEDKKTHDEIIEKYCNYEYSSRQANLKELELIDNFDFKKFNEYLDKEELDHTFHNFVKYCKDNEHELMIVSEGYDYYIDYILKRENIDLKFYANKLVTYVNEKGKIKVTCEFPNSEEMCSWCGTSKRNVIINHTNDLYNEVSVFIGDGASDACAVNYADIVFAKGKLASFCWKNNITYHEFNNFDDITKKLDKLKLENKIKHRQVAKTHRKDVLLGG
jgi:2-hydroxy-3-keto-5-methylthiopentenyl-1-phosphate phosphatase